MMNQSVYSNIFQLSPIPMYLVDITTASAKLEGLNSRNPEELMKIFESAVVVDANEAAVLRGGVETKEELFVPITRFIGNPPEEFKRSIVETLLDNEQFFEGELETVSLTGEKKYQLLRASLFWEGEEKIFAMVSLIDITREKEIQKALEESEARYRRLTENAKDLIYRMKLPEGIYEYVSPGSLPTTGHPPEYFMENPSRLREVIHPDWHSYFDEQWNRLIKGEMPEVYEFQIVDPDGNVRWMHQRNVLVKNGDGTPQAIEGIVTDITPLMLSQKELEKSVEEKEILLKEVHHRVKNNLSLISSIIDIQKQYNQDSPFKDLLGQLQRRIHTIGAVHGMLYESEDLRRVPTKVYIDELTNMLREMVSLEDEDINIEKRVENTFLEITHLIPVGLILTELFTNSVKHAKPDTGRLKIEVSLKTADRTMEMFYQDNGQGLADSSIIEQPKHLGFSIIRALLKKAEGTLEYVPPSRFRIVIPLK